jgi:protein-S-isoprenylcysteine O-methyltransferase Ste14
MGNEPQTGDSANVIALPPVIFAAGFAAGLVLQWLLPFHAFSARPVRLIGLGLTVVSGLLALWAAQTMRRARTCIDPRRSTSAIVSSGPFRFTRNPLYVSLTLLCAGCGLHFDIPWVLITLIPTLLVVQNGVICREERYLEAKFGSAYLDYKKHSRRWL